MEAEDKDYTVHQLVTAWETGNLSRNDEYQRGATWTLQQKQGLIDSVFRNYPIPAIYLHRIVETGGLEGGSSTRFEVVDGQQRIRALTDYTRGKFALLDPTDRKLRLPSSMRSRPVSWARKKYDELDAGLRAHLDGAVVRAYVIATETHPDEVRDLFIRLQAGTALGRQQIRDAWPGKVGPFVETLAGKMDRQPSARLFRAVDLRGRRIDDEGERDDYVADRQTCAQLLRIFIAREADPWAFPGVAAGDLDALYHDHTDFDASGTTAGRFKETLRHAETVIDKAVALRRSKGEGRNKKKFRKLEVFAVMGFMQDLMRNPKFKVTPTGLSALAKQMTEADREGEPTGKITSGRSIAKYYEWWRNSVVTDLPGLHLDPRRLFGEEEKEAIWARDGGVCQLCGKAVGLEEEAEYDHYPVPYRDGGRTEIENGRLVHGECHPRGRPAADDD